uniref:TRPM SLOG domain-containing protein n=1 Tax=Ursus americanus TaxID=9643 RepID=A0A452RGR7_URSAM
MLCAPKLGPFLLNAVRWLAKGQTGKFGVNTGLKNLCALLSEHGLECSLQPHLTPDVRVYCCGAYSDKEAKQLQEFVAEGGGLLIGGQAWWWGHTIRLLPLGWPSLCHRANGQQTGPHIYHHQGGCACPILQVG